MASNNQAQRFAIKRDSDGALDGADGGGHSADWEDDPVKACVDAAERMAEEMGLDLGHPYAIREPTVEAAEEDAHLVHTFKVVVSAGRSAGHYSGGEWTVDLFVDGRSITSETIHDETGARHEAERLAREYTEAGYCNHPDLG